MRATRDLLRRRCHLMRKRAELLAHIQNTNSQYCLPPFGKKIAYRKNRDGVAGMGVLLDGSNVIRVFQQVSGEGMPKGMARSALGKATRPMPLRRSSSCCRFTAWRCVQRSVFTNHNLVPGKIDVLDSQTATLHHS